MANMASTLVYQYGVWQHWLLPNLTWEGLENQLRRFLFTSTIERSGQVKACECSLLLVVAHLLWNTLTFVCLSKVELLMMDGFTTWAEALAELVWDSFMKESGNYIRFIRAAAIGCQLCGKGGLSFLLLFRSYWYRSLVALVVLIIGDSLWLSWSLERLLSCPECCRQWLLQFMFGNLSWRCGLGFFEKK